MILNKLTKQEKEHMSENLDEAIAMLKSIAKKDYKVNDELLDVLLIMQRRISDLEDDIYLLKRNSDNYGEQ